MKRLTPFIELTTLVTMRFKGAFTKYDDENEYRRLPTNRKSHTVFPFAYLYLTFAYSKGLNQGHKVIHI